MWPLDSGNKPEVRQNAVLEVESTGGSDETARSKESARDRLLRYIVGDSQDTDEPRRKKLVRSPVFWGLVVVSVMLVTGVILAAALLTRHHVEAAGVVVDVGYSKYEGRALSNGINQWLGIRYARPPVGDLRFRDAQDPLFAEGVQEARKHGALCVNTATNLPPSQSEDCLFLDVYAPAAAPALLPVYVYIQGGGFNSLSNPNYNASGLITASDNNIVVVTFNYRVGLYGFLASSEVVKNGDTNIGLKDQRKVFEWVQKHIEKFGGDPKHVTIGGSSAGAASVTLQLTAYGGRNDNLFHATAAQSQSFGTKFNVSGSQYQYDALIGRIGCNAVVDSLSCLRNKTTRELQAVNIQIPSPGRTHAPLFMYSNVIDGNFTIDYNYDAFAQGRYIKLPAIWGADTNDGTIFAPRQANSTKDVDNFLLDNFPSLKQAQLDQINAYYPKSVQYPGSGEYWRTSANAYGDMRYMCPGLYTSSINTNASTILQSMFDNTSTPVYNYRYDVVDPGDGISGFGAKHTVEMGAIWGVANVQGTAPISYVTTNKNIIPVIQGYWTSFIRTYNPNTYRAPGSPIWEFYVQELHNRLKFETNATAMETVSAEQQASCAYLSSIGVSAQQ